MVGSATMKPIRSTKRSALVLRRWMDREGITTADQVARRAGISASSVRAILRGEPAGGRVARALVLASSGAVALDDLLRIPTGVRSGEPGAAA